MAVIEQVVPIDFGSGIDTKTDSKRVQPGKFLSIQNGIFTNPKRVTKRNGYDLLTTSLVGGGTWSIPTMVKGYRNELLLAATTSSGQRLLSYSQNLSAWSDRGKYLSIAVSKNEIAGFDAGGSRPFGGTTNSNAVVLGNLTLYIYEANNNGSIQLRIAVIDNLTGMHLESSTTGVIGTGSKPKAVVLGGSQLAIAYIDGSANLQLSLVTVNSSGVTVAAARNVSASVTTFDLRATSTGGIIAYQAIAGSTILLQTVNTSGTSTHTATIASTGSVAALYVGVNASTDLWVYWSTASSVFYAVYNASLANTLTKTTIATGLNLNLQITAVDISSVQQTVYYSTYYTDALTPSISKANVNNAGTVTSQGIWLNNVDIYSNIVTLNSINYMAVMFMSDLTPTGFIVDLTDGLAVAKFLPDSAEGIMGSGTSTVQRYAGFTSTLTLLTSTKLFLAAGIVTTLTPEINTTASGLTETSLAAVMSMVGMTFDFNSVDAFQSVIQQDTVVLNGGIVSQYDGSSVAELGFSTDPEVIGSTSNSGGNLGSGTWQCFVTYEWTDALGNLHQSAPSVAYYAVFASGTTNDITIKAKTLTMTQKTGVNIVLWRTIVNGTLAYRTASANNDPTTNYVTFSGVGTVADATIKINATLYTEAGAIIDNIAPPPAMILWVNNNRPWCVDSENPETTIEYGKTASAGSGIAFSTGLLEYVVDSRLGAISGVSPMDEKTVVLKQSGLGYFIGDGANDAGTGSTLTPLQFIPSDTGCSNSKSVILYPNGVLFRASDNKGLYILSRGLQCAYFGMEAEAYNSQDVQSAQIVGNKNQIRSLTSSGSSLLFDYVFNQWSTFSNHTGLSADVFQGAYVYVRTDGSLFEEDISSFLDNATAYQLSLQTAWIPLASVQGYQRVKQLEILGDYANGSSALHGLKITPSYDFGTGNILTGSPISYYFGSASSSGPFQFRLFFPTQKCDAISLLIQEITTSASGESLDLTNMSLLVGVKKGAQKIPASQSVG